MCVEVFDRTLREVEGEFRQCVKIEKEEEEEGGGGGGQVSWKCRG